jgi:hypothetical protein
MDGASGGAMENAAAKALLISVGTVTVFAAVALWPMSIVTYPPLQDLPNHLARIAILTSSPTNAIQEFYKPSWSVLPNLGIDVLLVGLSKIMSLAFASKVAVSVAVVLWLAAPFALHAAAYKRFSIVPIVSSLAVYNLTFEMGFLNFYFGSSLFVFGFAIWIALESQQLLLRAAVGLLISYILFFSHLFVFATFAICVLVWELIAAWGSIFSRKTSQRELILLGSTFGPPTATFIFLSPHSDGKLFVGLLSQWTRGLSQALLSKIDYIDRLIPVGWNGEVYAAALVCALFIAAIYCRPPGMDGRLLACCLAMAALLLALPPFVAGGSNVDWRMIAPLALLFAGSIRLVLPKWISVIAFLASAALLGSESISVSEVWKKGESNYVSFSSLLTEIPAGSRMYYSTIGMSFPQAEKPPSVLNESSFALIEKCIVVPSIFAFRSQQPLSIQPGYLEVHNKLWLPFNETVDSVDWSFVEKNSDFVVLASDNAQADVDRPTLHLLKRVGQFNLYEVSASGSADRTGSVPKLEPSMNCGHSR